MQNLTTSQNTEIKRLWDIQPQMGHLYHTLLQGPSIILEEETGWF